MNKQITRASGKSFLDQFPVGCVVSDFNLRILYSNEFLAQSYGYTTEQLQGTDLSLLLSRASRIICDSYIVPLVMREETCEDIRLSLVTGDGGTLPVLVSVRRDESDDKRIFWSFVNAQRSEKLYRELTQTKSLLEQKNTQLLALSEKDQLTGLPNRACLTRQLTQQISRPGFKHPGFALAFMDLDGFKDINDRFGHDVGDKLLQLVANRMSENLRAGDLVARFGGDEFVVLINGEFSADTAKESLNRLALKLSESFDWGEGPIHVCASIGVTLYPQADDIDPDQLIRQADQAMYQAKLAGRRQVCVFNTDQEQFQKGRNEELKVIRKGIAEGQFELHFQPKVNMRTGEILGAEALLRWNHPIDGQKLPMTFLSTVNATDVGVELERWVIADALTRLQDWHSKGLDLPISINVAGYHLQHPEFLRHLAQMLIGVPEAQKKQLEIEVLETSVIEDIDQVASVLAACRSLGIRVSLDDFGTGYSTLNQVRDLSVDCLKIDRSFVRDMLTNKGDRAILKAVVALAHAFECDLIAEGVETRQHAQSLIELGCEWGQGYYIARPMPASAFAQWVEDWHTGDFHNKFRA